MLKNSLMTALPCHTSQNSGFSWNSHCILTRYALSSCHAGRLDEKVPVVRLEDFLHKARNRVREIAARHRSLLHDRTGISVPSGDSPDAIENLTDFLSALRLNPTIDIPYVRALLPEEAQTDSVHARSRRGPPRSSYTTTDEHEMISGREILAVFSDEPDWGMDQDLFPIAAYGYGAPPFGSAAGMSSQASFHMAFFHGHPLIAMLFPQVRRTFPDLRIRVFFALAGSALEHKIPYWSYRFRAWAMHYLQDLTQPYHAKSLPFPIWTILGRFIRNPVPRTFVEKNKNLLMNRHHLFEEMIHLILNQTVKSRQTHPFSIALQGDGMVGQEPLDRVLKKSSKIAADSAVHLDRLLEQVDERSLNDPEYLIAEDREYPLEQIIDRFACESPELFDRFLKTVAHCLIETGNVSRYAAAAYTIGSNRAGSYFVEP